MKAAELLTSLGFERLGASRAHDGMVLWMLSCGARDILVTLREKATPADAAEAIYEAGLRDKRDEIQGRYQAFTDALKYTRVDTLWVEARELQRELKEKLVAAANMPKA